MALPIYTPDRRREIAHLLVADEQYVYQLCRGLKVCSPVLANKWNKADPDVKLWDARPDDWHLIWPELIGTDGAPAIKQPAKTV